MGQFSNKAKYLLQTELLQVASAVPQGKSVNSQHTPKTKCQSFETRQEVKDLSYSPTHSLPSPQYPAVHSQR